MLYGHQIPARGSFFPRAKTNVLEGCLDGCLDGCEQMACSSGDDAVSDGMPFKELRSLAIPDYHSWKL